MEITRVLHCRSGEVVGTKKVKIKADLTKDDNFPIDCPEKGCVATIVVDNLLTPPKRSARCTQTYCRLNPFYKGDDDSD